MYESGDTLNAPPQPQPKPAGVALRIPPHTTNVNLPNSKHTEESYYRENKLEEDEVDIGYTGVFFPRQPAATSATTAPGDAFVADSSSYLPAAARETSASSGPGSRRRLDRSDAIDVDLYASADGDSSPGCRSPQAVQLGFGTYALIDNAKSQTTSASQGETYAVVNKSKPQAAPASIESGVGRDENGGVDACDVYAVVDKSSQGRMAGAVSLSPAPSPAKYNAGRNEPSRDVYAKVDKRAKGINSKPSGQAAAEPEIETYAQVQKPKPGAKPKPKPKKPKPGVKPKPKPALKPTVPEKPTSHDASNGDTGVDDRKRTGN